MSKKQSKQDKTDQPAVGTTVAIAVMVAPTGSLHHNGKVVAHGEQIEGLSEDEILRLQADGVIELLPHTIRKVAEEVEGEGTQGNGSDDSGNGSDDSTSGSNSNEND